MSRLDPKQMRLVAQVSLAVLEAVEAAGEHGAPGGVLYTALVAQGASLSQYESLMRTLTNPGYLVRDGDCYHCTPTTAAFKSKLQRVLENTAAA